MRSVQMAGSVHAQRLRTSPSGRVRGAAMPSPGHCVRLRFRLSGHATSTFLRPFAPPALPGFHATMDALTPERPALRRPRPAQRRRLYTHEHRPVCHSGLPASRVWPSGHSVSNHLTAPAVAFAHNPSARQARSGLRLARAGSPVGPAESSSSSYGLPVHLQLLPTSSRENAVTVDYRPECVCLERTRTSQTKHAHRRTRAAGLPVDDEAERALIEVPA